jgi:crotonobetainyl-CoA:carnitine CoA-transferase CaiB-like acyl-CoA transferase
MAFIRKVQVSMPNDNLANLPDEFRPLHGLTVLDFSQFLAGPSSALRLADMGARVIKIERPNGGELGRHLYISNLKLDGDSTLFHSINRNKQSFTADLKDPRDAARVRELVGHADVMIQSFRPGVVDRLGLDFESMQLLNPGLVYGSISGYGNAGPWREKPGQDLLVQSLSGLTWLTGDQDQGPVPMGLAVADILAGAHLSQGILACLVRRGISGKGGLVEVSLLESVIDLQFEVITTYLNDGHRAPQRSSHRSAHAYLAAPYGIYPTEDGYIAIAMNPVDRLGELIGADELATISNQDEWFDRRDEIKQVIARHLLLKPTATWLAMLEPHGIWCSDVFTWDRLFGHDAFLQLGMTQTVTSPGGSRLETTRCPIRIDGALLGSTRGAPRVGQDNDAIERELSLH